MREIIGSNDKEIVFYTAKDLQKIFGCSLGKAYEIMHDSTFPSLRINRTLLVSKEKLLWWIDKNAGRSIKLS